MQLPLQTEPSVLNPFIELVWTITSEYWWVGAIVLLAWYLRWYGIAKENDVSSPIAGGTMAFVKHFFAISKRAVGVLVLLGFLALSSLAVAFDLGGTLMMGLGGFDPIVWATTAAGVVTFSNAFDAAFATPQGIVLTFIGTFAVLVAINTYRRWSDEVDDDGDSDDSEKDRYSYDFLYAYRDD
jgi:hypothetical protein